jgi:hypothetical protein
MGINMLETHGGEIGQHLFYLENQGGKLKLMNQSKLPEASNLGSQHTQIQGTTCSIFPLHYP